MWGYKPIPGATTPEAEKKTLDEWARQQDATPWLRFSTEGSAGTDPGELTEAVGDEDAVAVDDARPEEPRARGRDADAGDHDADRASRSPISRRSTAGCSASGRSR